VQITKGVGFRRAIEILRKQLSSLAASTVAGAHGADAGEAAVLAADAVVKLAPILNLSADNQKLVNETVDYYHGNLDEAWPYLERRGLGDRAMANHHKLGFANRTLSYHLPNKQLKAGKEIRSRLIEIGLLRETGHETLSGSLIFPIFDEAGNVVGIYGRKVSSGLREGTPLHLYLKGKHKGVWNWQGIAESKEVIL
jgi:hypothetical protein